MNYIRIKSNNILSISIMLSIILVFAIYFHYRSYSWPAGLEAAGCLVSGFWSGIASGAVACLTALIFVVFGMKYLLMDPVNIKEWTDIRATENSPGMEVYFAYQTFAGAIMHLFVLGAIMGLLLGAIGGFIGKVLHSLKN